MSAPDVQPPGWYRDPTGQGDGRYWNGASWTEAVDRSGTSVDVPIDPTWAQVPPTPGTQIAKPIPYTTTYNVQESPSSGSPWGAIIGFTVVVLAAIVIYAVATGDSSDDTPPPDGTEVPAAPEVEAPADTEAPAPPASDGG